MIICVYVILDHDNTLYIINILYIYTCMYVHTRAISTVYNALVDDFPFRNAAFVASQGTSFLGWQERILEHFGEASIMEDLLYHAKDVCWESRTVTLFRDL